MPRLVAELAFFTPLYHLVNVCRAFSAGSLSGAGWSTAWLIVAAALLAPLPFRLMRKRVLA
jgi:hypothetical protein